MRSVDALTKWVVAQWDASVGISYTIAGVKERRVVVDLHFQLQVPDGDPIMRTDLVIRSFFHQQGVAEAIAPQRQAALVLRGEVPIESAQRVEPEVSVGVEGPSSPPSLDSAVGPRREKRKVEWTVVLTDIVWRQRWEDDVERSWRKVW